MTTVMTSVNLTKDQAIHCIKTTKKAIYIRTAHEAVSKADATKCFYAGGSVKVSKAMALKFIESTYYEKLMEKALITVDDHYDNIFFIG